jgi:hypothetical protein
MVGFSFGKEGRKSKEYLRFQREESKTARNNADKVFRKNFEMQSNVELRFEKSEKDQLNFMHDKFQQYYKKVKVEGCPLLISLQEWDH